MFQAHFVMHARNKRKNINKHICEIIYSLTVIHLLHLYLLFDGCQFVFASKFHDEDSLIYIRIIRGKTHSIIARINLYDMRFNITLLQRIYFYIIHIRIFYLRHVKIHRWKTHQWFPDHLEKIDTALSIVFNIRGTQLLSFDEQLLIIIVLSGRKILHERALDISFNI